MLGGSKCEKERDLMQFRTGANENTKRWRAYENIEKIVGVCDDPLDLCQLLANEQKERKSLSKWKSSKFLHCGKNYNLKSTHTYLQKQILPRQVIIETFEK